MSVDLTKGATVELVKRLSDDLRTKDDNTKYSSAGAAMRDKANVNGYYEDLVSGGTDQIISSVYEEDKVPYLFRTSGGSLDIGDREEDTIVGGTVAWNQQVDTLGASSVTDYGITFTNNGDGTLTINGTASNTSAKHPRIVANNINWRESHIYFIDMHSNKTASFNIRATSTVTLNLGGNYSGVAIGKPSEDVTGGLVLRFAANAGTAYDNVTIRPQIIDLTQMFGSTIADYIYSLEQANAGAGVAWFKKLFNKPYYEYDAGSMKHVEGLSAHKMRGFNAWDEEWEVGGIDINTGADYSSTGAIRSKNFNRIVSNTAYCITKPANVLIKVLYYDSEKNYISYNSFASASTAVYTTPTNASYLKIMYGDPNGTTATTYNHNICINLHWDGERDGEYEAYKENVYPLDDSLTLRGIPKLDANNNLYYDGDVYEADGTVTRKYGIVDLGTLFYSKTPSGLFQSSITGAKYIHNTVVANCVSPIYTPITSQSITGPQGTNPSPDKTMALVGTANGCTIYINNLSYTDAATFKSAMSGVYLVYELETSTTEQAEPYQTPQIVDDFGTEEYVTDSIVPVGHNTKYMPNLKAKLEMAPDSPSDNGDYIVRHANGKNEYVPLVIPTELPTMPSEDGTYTLKCTVSGSTKTLTWESES